jgi:hypothetical protein
VSSSNLPDAPQPQPLPDTGSASISGDVLDSSGAVVPNAKVTLMSTGGLKLRTATSGADGVFTFTRLPAATYLVVVEAPGFRPYASSGIIVSANQTYAMPKISLQIGGATTNVVVRPTEVIAQEQIKQEERQRVFGIIPNFYMSYTYDAAPMTTKQCSPTYSATPYIRPSFIRTRATIARARARLSRVRCTLPASPSSPAMIVDRVCRTTRTWLVR